MARYSGRQGVIYISTSASGTASSLSTMTTWTLDMPTDKIEVTAFGDSNKQYVAGLKDISGSIEGIWDDTSDTLYDAMASGEAVKMYLYPSSAVTTKYWYGTAFVDFAIAVGVSDAVTISGTFQGASNWGQL